MRRILTIISAFAFACLATSCEKDVTRLICDDLVGEWEVENIQYYQIVDGVSVEVEADKISSIQLYPDHHIIVTHSNIAYVIHNIRMYHSNYALIRGVIHTDWLSDYTILEYEGESMVLKIHDPPFSSKYYILSYKRLTDEVY